MTVLHLHDTLTGKNLPVTPADGSTLRFYCCGPTVYGPAHIGNFRTFINQDVMRRVLELSGTPTTHVRNITDVDDKTIRDSQAAGKTLTDFTDYWTTQFHADCNALNLLAPHVEPRATQHIPHQIAMIQTLMDRDHAYQSPDGSIYFRVSSFPNYGKLSHLDERELRPGTAPSANDSDEYSKDSVADFALWKAWKAEDGDNKWESPWGPGRPGWHLECSAMALEYLGETFDLHGGGVDLIFPHHENEIAQSCCSTNGQFARHWMHAAHLMVDGGKMSKSLGNLYTLADLGHRGFSPAVVRYTLLSGHYRQPLNFTLHSLDSSHEALQKLARFEQSLREVTSLAKPTHFQLIAHQNPGPFASAWSALLADLNVPGAIGQIFGTLNKTKIASLTPEEQHDPFLGFHFILDAIGIELPALATITESDIPAEIQSLAEQRWNAKQSKDWATSDTLRKELESKGWLIKDSKEGYTITKA
ncbi:cysteine--tRNA ligase [Phragmitibacter flavus]|uniref:Cysteine--tRNA ligase n=1 Tax=Phragmitibacter flavus TaxID=2576071 RepID=A0A5R8KGQ9_9BACT|nr:cysteine--tRNA ligase [Phragmitibacter flavus]TLD70789.1 cysteine--tRNA ligase [Phragmitibacter flavus]